MSESQYIEEIAMTTSKVMELGKVSEETQGIGGHPELIDPFAGPSA